MNIFSARAPRCHAAHVDDTCSTGPYRSVMRVVNGSMTCCVILVLALAPAPAALAADVSLKAVERPLPSFSLPTLDGATVDDEALEGKPWLINFWATWCPPCIEEMPAMNIAWEALEPAGVGMLAINVGETPETIGEFLARVPVDFPIVLGDGATTLPDFGGVGLPTTLVVDAAGQVVFEAVGPRDWDDPALIERIRALADATTGDPE